MMLHRPIPVWAILSVSIAVACYALWSLLTNLTKTGTTSISDYGLAGVFVSMIPAGILLAAGLSLFALTRWAILAAGLNLLVAISFFLVGGVRTDTIVWFVLSLGLFAYAIRLHRIGTLT